MYRKHWKTINIVNELKVLWRLVVVGNGWLWLTPCKRIKLRMSEWAQLGDSTQKGMSLVEGRLWSSHWCYHDRPSPTLATIFGPVSKMRSQASLHGVNHNLPFPTAQNPSFQLFQCFRYFASALNSCFSMYYQDCRRTWCIESTEKVKPTFRLKVDNGEIVVLPFFFCLS